MMSNVIMNEILGGTRASTRKPGDPITNADLLECYYMVPGAKGLVNKIVKSKWNNGFTEKLDITPDRFLEL